MTSRYIYLCQAFPLFKIKQATKNRPILSYEAKRKSAVPLKLSVTDHSCPVTAENRFCLNSCKGKSAEPLQSDADGRAYCLTATDSSLKSPMQSSSFSQRFHIESSFAISYQFLRGLSTKQTAPSIIFSYALSRQRYSNTPPLHRRASAFWRTPKALRPWF